MCIRDSNRGSAPKLLDSGGVTGLLSGFFGIGGGFLVVPGLMASTRMPILYAVGSSLVAVTAFGLTTSLNYARSGLVDWKLAAVFLVGGVAGGLLGGSLAVRLAARKGMLNLVSVSYTHLDVYKRQASGCVARKPIGEHPP